MRGERPDQPRDVRVPLEPVELLGDGHRARA
jgi:hypothetical protein